MYKEKNKHPQSTTQQTKQGIIDLRKSKQFLLH
jgi:hypothetical protein